VPHNDANFGIGTLGAGWVNASRAPADPANLRLSPKSAVDMT